MSPEESSEKPKRANEETPIEAKTLYEALKNIGITNVTTLMNRLGISREGRTSPEKENEEKIRDNVKRLLKLMELDETRNETVMLLQKIGLQGRDMLGEIPKPTIASAPIGKRRREIIPEEKRTLDSGHANQ